MIAPANAKNGNPAETARISTKASLHFCCLVLFTVLATPPQLGDTRPSWTEFSGWLYRNSLVVEYSKRFFGDGGSRFWDSELPLRCPFGGGLPGSGGGVLEVIAETILGVGLRTCIIGMSSTVDISSIVLLTALSRDPPRASILFSQGRCGLPPSRHIRAK
jgi:hypothetical protein